jgi:hypothetical protein
MSARPSGKSRLQARQRIGKRRRLGDAAEYAAEERG